MSERYTTTTGRDVSLESIVNVDAMREHGRQHALLGGALEPQPTAIEPLTAFGRAVARDARSEEFDPERYAQDELRAAENNRIVRALGEAQIVEAHGLGAVVASERALASADEPGQEPAVGTFVTLSAIFVMTFSFAPTLHDRVFLDFEDAIAAWLASFLTGGFLAAFVVSMLTLSVPVVGRLGALVNAIGVLAGFGFGIAAGVLRWSIVDSIEGQLMAIGMTLMELCAVAFLEWLALSMRDSHCEWTARRAAFNRLSALCKADREHHVRCTQSTAALKRAVDEHVRYVESRWIRKHKADDIERMAIDAILSGYHEGISQNCGYTRGLRRVS